MDVITEAGVASEAGELGGVSQNLIVVGKHFLKMV